MANTKNSLEKFRISIRDPKVKLTNKSAKNLIKNARTNFSPLTWKKILPWLYQVNSPSLRRILPRRIESWGHLQFSFAIGQKSLFEEIEWALLCIEQNKEIIKSFRTTAESYEQLYILGNSSDAKTVLEKIKKDIGYSFWLIKASIHHAATFDGLEAQKEVAHTILHESPRSLTSFLSWYMSERNEEKVSATGFSRRMTEILDGTFHIPELQRLLLCELLGATVNKDFALTLAAYSTGSAIDYYEVLVALIRLICKEKLDPESDEKIQTARQRLSLVANDVRLNDKKLQLQNNSEEISTISLLNNIDQWAVQTTLAGYTPLPRSKIAPHISSLLSEYLAIVTRNNDREELQQKFDKFSMNASHLVFVSSLEQSLTRRTKCLTNDTAYSKTEIAEGVQNILKEDCVFYSAAEEAYISALNAPPSNKILISRLTNIHNSDEKMRFLLAEQLRSATKQGRQKNIVDFLELSVAIIVHQNTIFQEIDHSPIYDAIFGKLKNWKSDIRAAIFVDHYIQYTGSTRLDTKLQLLVKWILESETLKLSNNETSDEQPKNEIIHFLRYVCIQKNLTLLATIEKSGDRRRERMAICRRLIDLDQRNSSIYEDEIKDLTLDNLKEEGLHKFDQSRVFVNVQGLLKICAVDYTESFERFLDLCRLPESDAPQPTAVLRDLVSTGKSGLDVIASKQGLSEVKEIFLDMLHGLADGYLNDPAHGLDSFLSLRIRHGSMASSIRGPLEEAQLTTSHSKLGDKRNYEPNFYWLSELCEDGANSIVNEKLNNFAHDADTLINNVISDYVQIASIDHPNGVFKLLLPEDLIDSLQIKAQTMKQSKEFFDLCFKTFGFALEPCLINLRSIIEHEIKRPLDELLSKLARDIDTVVPNEKSTQFTHVVNQTRVTVQQAVDRVMGWYQLRDYIESIRTYSIEELVEICVAIAQNTHTGFTPNVRSAISKEDKSLRVSTSTNASIFRCGIHND